MPVPLALPLGLGAGAALAWLASGGAGGRDRDAPRAAVYLGALVLGPAAAYLELVAGAWSNLYAFELPSAVDLVLCAAIAASPWCGVALARRGLAHGDARPALALAGACAVLVVGGAAAFADRIGVVTSYAAYHRGLGGDALLDHRAGAALVGAVAAIVAGIGAAMRAVAPHRLTSRPASPTLRA